MSAEINTHGLIMTNGRHKGELLTRVPVSYLKWMINAAHGMAKEAEAELKRRGTVTPTLEISGHAIDRASLNCRKIWHETRGSDEGLHAWLARVSDEALKTSPDQEGRRYHMGMRFVFDESGVWPVLKTVVRKDDRRGVASLNEIFSMPEERGYPPERD